MEVNLFSILSIYSDKVPLFIGRKKKETMNGDLEEAYTWIKDVLIVKNQEAEIEEWRFIF